MTAYTAPGIRAEANPYNFADIETVVCDFYGESLNDVYSPTRKLQPRWCRHLICFFAVELMGISLMTIGRHIGRHHATVIGGRRAVIDRKSCEQMFSAEVNEMRNRIKERCIVGNYSR